MPRPKSSRLEDGFAGGAASFLILLAASLLSFSSAFAQADRFFKPTEGFLLAKDLPDDFEAPVRSIQLEIKDVFEGSTVHSEAESGMFEIGNLLHIESRHGTIRRRLLFKEGDTVTKDLLAETEKALRSEPFLADAYIEVRKWDDGTAHLIVTTYDQWTLNLGFTPQISGGEFFYNTGIVESNLLGTGQRLGFFFGHERVRNTGMVDYNNNALTPWRLRFGSRLALLSDGYSTLVTLGKPLESRSDRYSFSASVSSAENSEFVYFDANQLDRLPEPEANRLAGRPNLLFQFEKVASHEAGATATRSFGKRTKFNVSPALDWKERYNQGRRFNMDTLVNALLVPNPSARRPEERFDFLGGVSFSLYQYDYKTVRNFRNLKWSETLETGWRLTTKVSQNQEWLGADNGDFYLSHSSVFNGTWWDAVFLNTSASLRYFVSPGGDFDNGFASMYGEVQWKPHPLTSSLLAATYAGHFAAEQSHQLLLGEDNGLNGYPNAYYAGQALLLLEAEQRYFPGFEFGTLVPALALFGNAGNTFPTPDEFDTDNLHYAIGVGLRLGFSKTVQKLVYHFNLSRPVDEDRLDGLRFGFRVKQSL